jgi:hypothetical protein
MTKFWTEYSPCSLCVDAPGRQAAHRQISPGVPCLVPVSSFSLQTLAAAFCSKTLALITCVHTYYTFVATCGVIFTSNFLSLPSAVVALFLAGLIFFVSSAQLLVLFAVCIYRCYFIKLDHPARPDLPR